MDLCASYRCDAEHRKLIQQIRCTPANVIDLLSAGEDKLILMELRSFKDSGFKADKLHALTQENTNLTIDCFLIDDLIFLRKQFADMRLMYHYPVNVYNDLYFLLQFHPYAISVSEPLTFELPNVRKYLQKHSEDYIFIRVQPAIGRPQSWNVFLENDNGMRHFFIPPAMLHIYEPYVDVLDLQDLHPVREQALVTVYAKGSYTPPLSTLIQNCEIDLPTEMLNDDELFNARLTCGQHCITRARGCHICDTWVAAVKALKPSQS